MMVQANDEQQKESNAVPPENEKKTTVGIEEEDVDKSGQQQQQMPLIALNHVSRLCKSVEGSVEFYTKVLGFVLINRPPTLDFNGAWLFNYGVGIHLVQKEDGGEPPDASVDHLDSMDNHISFQCEDMEAMERRLKEMGIKYLRRTIKEEEGSPIDQLFFNDLDGFMIVIGGSNTTSS
ncbi:hypothetical protein Cni_G09803 [Canna indica]|uniref:VOC domain-containing protein n=1 Tax=Canna indica TaxID=4628 RepID=A0AAQ3K351_9LILI|nr:hypothetical protein Cni_G09803 [Canna indica]